MRQLICVFSLLSILWGGGAYATSGESAVTVVAMKVHEKSLSSGGARHEILVVVTGHATVTNGVLVIEAPPSSFRRLLVEYCKKKEQGPAMCDMSKLMDELMRDMLAKTQDFLAKNVRVSLEEWSLELDALHEEVIVQVTTEDLAFFLARERLETMEEGLLKTLVGVVVGDRVAGHLFQSGADVFTVVPTVLEPPFRWLLGKMW